MIIHDLKHPTESLIDSLQIVMKHLKKLELFVDNLKLLSCNSNEISCNVNQKLQKLLLKINKSEILYSNSNRFSQQLPLFGKILEFGDRMNVKEKNQNFTVFEKRQNNLN